MVRRDVEHLEVREVVLDLRALVGHEPELAEDVGDLADRLDDRVERAAADRPAGRRDVDSLGGEARLERGAAQQLPPLGQGGLDRAADVVRDGPDLGPILRGQRADAAQDDREPALAPEDVELDRLERRDVAGGRDRGERLVAQRLEIAGQLGQLHRPSP